MAYENLMNALPIMAAGLSGKPSVLQNTVQMQQLGRQQSDEAKLRKFGSMLFSGGKMPQSENEIIAAAKAAGIEDFSKVMPVVANYMKYRRDMAEMSEAKKSPHLVPVEGQKGLYSQANMSPDELAQHPGAIPGSRFAAAPGTVFDPMKQAEIDAYENATPEQRARAFGLAESPNEKLASYKLKQAQAMNIGFDGRLKREKAIREMVNKEVETRFTNVMGFLPTQGTPEYDEMIAYYEKLMKQKMIEYGLVGGEQAEPAAKKNPLDDLALPEKAPDEMTDEDLLEWMGISGGNM